EVAGYEPGPLVNQLIEGMLAIGARLAPIYRAGRIVDVSPIDGDVLSVALHGQLLQIGRKPFQVLLVRQHRNCLGAEEIVVPNAQEAHENRQILLEWYGAEMFVHLMEAL